MTNNPFLSRDTAIFLTTPGGSLYLSHTNVENIQFLPCQRLHLRGMLPWRRDLLDIEDGCSFEILHAQCGPMDWYDSINVIFKINNCKIVERHIKNAVDCQSEHVLFVDVIFDCEIEIPQWGQQ